MNAIIPVASSKQLEAQEKNKRKNEENQLRPIIVGLSSHVNKRWTVMRDHKKQEIENK